MPLNKLFSSRRLPWAPSLVIRFQITPMLRYNDYEPVLTEHFPRTEYRKLDFYAGPEHSETSRILWAARDARREWIRAVDARDWDAIDYQTFRLALLDRSHEL